jgi:hypothetical protein
LSSIGQYAKYFTNPKLEPDKLNKILNTEQFHEYFAVINKDGALAAAQDFWKQLRIWIGAKHRYCKGEYRTV